MFAKGILVFCASALFAQSALSQCLGRSGSNWGYDGLAYDGLGYPGAWNGRLGCGCGGIAPAVELAASYGGGLGVSSSSCAAPTGLAVTSENMYEGPVAVAGNLPFLGTAGVEGVFPTAGGSVISYGCGDGVVAITAEGPFEGAYGAAAITPAAIAPAAIASAAITPAMAPWGYAGVPARGCGCGASYPY